MLNYPLIRKKSSIFRFVFYCPLLSNLITKSFDLILKLFFFILNESEFTVKGDCKIQKLKTAPKGTVLDRDLQKSIEI